jgi:hypothetical protein
MIEHFPFVLSLSKHFKLFLMLLGLENDRAGFETCPYHDRLDANAGRMPKEKIYGFQPLAFNSSLAFFTKLSSKMSATLMSRCTFVVRFMSSIIDCNTLSSLNPSLSVSRV